MAGLLDSAGIANILSSSGPVVKCVVLRAGGSDQCEEPGKESDVDEKQDKNDGEKNLHEELVEEIEMDTTPSKNEAKKILGGPFTFIGQYEEEGIVLMAQQGMIFSTEEDDREPVDPKESLQEQHEEDLKGLSISEIRTRCKEMDVMIDKTMLEKRDLIDAYKAKLKQLLQSLPPLNPHTLQPPFTNVRIRGDILVLKVAEVDEPLDEEADQGDIDEGDAQQDDQEGESTEIRENSDSETASAPSKAENGDTETKPNDAADTETKPNDTAEGVEETESNEMIHVPSNDEFFLNYTRDQYLEFAARTDVQPPPQPDYDSDEEDEEDRSDEEEDEEFRWYEDMDCSEEEEKGAMLNFVMSEVLRKFRESHGRGPDTLELLDLRANVASQLGVEVATFDESVWKKAPSKKRKAKPSSEGEDAVKSILARPVNGDDEDSPTDSNGSQGPSKRVKFDQEVQTKDMENGTESIDKLEGGDCEKEAKEHQREQEETRNGEKSAGIDSAES